MKIIRWVGKKSKWFGLLWRPLRYVMAFLILLLAPFFVLVRGAVWFYTEGWGGYPSVIASSIITVAILVIYFIVVNRYFSRRTLVPLKHKIILVCVIVASYNTFCLWVVSDKPIKSGEDVNEYTQLHPLLRIAVGTVAYFDSTLLVTDMQRRKSDYKKMGLPPKARSMHYPQHDGYVYAVDIRTKGRFFLYNLWLQGSFRLLGLKTLRHVGNEDHLHVSLPVIH